MSQYGFNPGEYGGSFISGDVSGITFTINPLSTPGVGDPHGFGSPLQVSNGTGGGSTFSMLSSGIDPYITYTQNDATATDPADLNAATPIFWVLSIHEITNPRLQAYFDSNISGWGQDIRFYLEGYSGRNDVSNNTNNSRTSDAVFLNVTDSYFNTTNATPFTSGTLFNTGGVGSLGETWDVMASVLSPYNWLTDGAGNASGSANLSPNSTSITRAVSRTYVTKEPTLSYKDSLSNLDITNLSEIAKQNFNLNCEIFEAGAWVNYGTLQNIVGYRSVFAAYQVGSLNTIQFPNNTHTGAYFGWNGDTLINGLAFNYAATWNFNGANAWGGNADYVSWTSAFSTTLTPNKGFPKVDQSHLAFGVSSGANTQFIVHEDGKPANLFGFEHDDQSCGTFLDIVYTLTAGTGKNWDTHIDTESEHGGSHEKSIFGYKDSQGAMDLYNVDCSHTTTALSNTTSTNQLRHVDHHEYWYAFTNLDYFKTTKEGLGGAMNGENVAVAPSSYIFNQPVCADKLDWETHIIDHEYIPAPISDPNLDEFYFARVKPSNTWNVPTGVEAIEIWSNPSYAGNSVHLADQNGWKFISWKTKHWATNQNCSSVNISWRETKAVCYWQNKAHNPTAAFQISAWNITTTDATCSAPGTIDFEYTWEEACLGRFYRNAPDDYNIQVKLHLSKDNTGIITDTIITNVDNTAMSFNPSTCTGAQSGVAYGSISVPCGDYYTHSIEVMPMTSSMFTSGNSGDSHIWMTGSGGSTWSGLANTNNQVQCPSNPPSISCVTTNATCGALGTLTVTTTGGTAPFVVAVVDTSSGFPAGMNTGTPVTFNLSAGTYLTQVTDSLGCTDTCTQTITSGGTALTVTETVVDPTHCILSNGSITLSVSGGTGPYTVVWKETTTNTTLPYTGLSANPLPSGSYSYTLTDSAGCSATGTVTVGAAPLIGLTCSPATIGLDPSGAGLSDGLIQVSIQNNSGSYPINGSVFAYNPDVCVYNSSGVQQVCDGTFAGFNNLFGFGTSATMVVPGLPADTYDITVDFTPHILDSGGAIVLVPAVSSCTLTCQVTLSDPGSSPSVTVGTIGTASCIPGNDGTIQLTAAGGSTSAFHHWDFEICTDAAMTMGCQTFTGTSTFGDNTTGNVHTFTGLSAGTYYATVTPCFGVNGLTCQSASAVSAVITVPSLGGPTLTLTGVNPTCPGLSDGSITPAVSGGTGPYLYQYWHPTTLTWVPGGGTTWALVGNTTALPASAIPYTFQAIDANGCVSSDTVTLVDPPAIDFTQVAPNPTTVPATCGANDGSITFFPASGGTITAPHTTFQYDLYNSSGVIVQTLGAGNVGTVVPQWVGILGADTYTLRATDSNGCYAEITITVNLATFTTAVSHSDQGCTFPPSNDGSLQIVVSPWANIPIPNYTYVWTNSSGVVVQNETIAGTTSTLLTGLPADTYTYSVTDGNGCSVNGTQIISLSADTQENVSVVETAMSCPTGCGILNISNTTGDFPLFVEISDDAGATWTRVSTAANSAATAFTSIDLAIPGIQIDNNNFYKENTSTRFCLNMGATFHIRTFSQVNSCPSVPVIHTMANTAYVPMVFTESLYQPTCCSCNTIGCNGSILNVISNGAPIAQGVVGTLMSYDWTLTHDGITIGAQTGSSFTGGVQYIVSSTTPANPTPPFYDPEWFDEIIFSGLFPGTYVFTATDDCGVTHTETWTLIDPRVYVTDIITSQPLCAYGCDDGTIEVVATGGSSGTYQFSMDDGVTWQPAIPSASTTYTYTGVGPGTWNIWARDPSCGSQILFDPSDNVLTADNGCYSDFITGIWPAGTQSTLTPISNLNTQWVSTTNNSLPGSSDGEITVNILGGVAPYEVSVITSAAATACDECALQTAGVITPGLNQYININGVNVSNTGITTVASNGALVIDNLSVSLDFSGTALGAYYTIYVKDAAGCFSCISQYVDNGTLGIISIYSAEDCNCSCPTGYSLINPVPAPPALPCAGTSPDAPSFIGSFNAPNSIQQFGGNNLTSGSYGTSGGRLYVPVGATATTFTPVSLADTFTKTSLSSIPGFPGMFASAGSGAILKVALDASSVPQAYGSIFDTRLWDIGIWPQQSNPNNVIAVPLNEWIGVPIEISFGSSQLCILGIAGDGDYKITLNCGTFLTSNHIPNVQLPIVDALNYEEYAMIPVLIPEGDHTLTFWVKNNTANLQADQVAGLAFDLFQGSLASGLSTTSVFVGATTQAQLDPYYILDVNGKKITSRNITAGLYEHDFLMGDTNGYQCASGCVIMDNGNITCLSNDTADCTLPINCPEYLSDLVECLGTLSNEVYDKMITGLLENKLDIREVWLVVLTKYLIKNLNPCITLQELLSWAKFLEDVCPDCENTYEGTRTVPNTSVTTNDDLNLYDF